MARSAMQAPGFVAQGDSGNTMSEQSKAPVVVTTKTTCHDGKKAIGRIVKSIAYRLLTHVLPLILLVVVISFFLIQLAPGSFVEIMTSEMQLADPEVIQQLKVTYGLDQPVYVQLFKYIWALLHLDFGFSYRQNVPVIDAVFDHLPATLLLMLSSLAIAVVVGVATGALAASRPNGIVDRVISLIAAFCFAAPSFWVGIMLIVLFSVKLGWLPVGDMQSIGSSKGILGDALDILRHLALPAIALGLFHSAVYIRVTRSAMLDIANADFVRTARAKGLSQSRVTIAHILRNAMLPVVTLIGLQFGHILSGSVVIETVFSWPGIGNLLFDAVMTRDYPVVLGILVLGSVVTILANLVVDLLYVRLDPRVTLE